MAISFENCEKCKILHQMMLSTYERKISELKESDAKWHSVLNYEGNLLKKIGTLEKKYHTNIIHFLFIHLFLIFRVWERSFFFVFVTSGYACSKGKHGDWHSAAEYEL